MPQEVLSSRHISEVQTNWVNVLVYDDYGDCLSVAVSTSVYAENVLSSVGEINLDTVGWEEGAVAKDI